MSADLAAAKHLEVGLAQSGSAKPPPPCQIAASCCNGRAEPASQHKVKGMFDDIDTENGTFDVLDFGGPEDDGVLCGDLPHCPPCVGCLLGLRGADRVKVECGFLGRRESRCAGVEEGRGTWGEWEQQRDGSNGETVVLVGISCMFLGREKLRRSSV